MSLLPEAEGYDAGFTNAHNNWWYPLWVHFYKFSSWQHETLHISDGSSQVSYWLTTEICMWLLPSAPLTFPGIFTLTFDFRAYNSSKLYRELRLRGAVVHNKQLKMLSLEQVFSTIHGVWNLSSNQGSLGIFIITNVRVVWFADMNEAFNVSLPYLHIDGVSSLNPFGNITSN